MSEQLGRFIENEMLDAINYFRDRPGTGRGGRVTKLDITHYKVDILLAVKEDREKRQSERLESLREIVRVLGKVVPADRDAMIRWAVASGDSVYTNAGVAYCLAIELLEKEETMEKMMEKFVIREVKDDQ